MKITLFTSNNHRHNYLVNLLAKICDELWVVQEYKNQSIHKNSGTFRDSNIIKNSHGIVIMHQKDL